MSHFKQGGEEHLAQAREALGQLRAMVADPANVETFAKDADGQAFLKEAEALIEGPASP